MPVLEACQAGGLQLQLWHDEFHSPYAKLMAMLVLVAKLHLQKTGPPGLFTRRG